MSAATSSRISSVDFSPPEVDRAYHGSKPLSYATATHRGCRYSTHLCEEDAVEQDPGLLLVLGDVSISMHPKHLRISGERKTSNIVQIALMLGEERVRGRKSEKLSYMYMI